MTACAPLVERGWVMKAKPGGPASGRTRTTDGGKGQRTMKKADHTRSSHPCSCEYSKQGEQGRPSERSIKLDTARRMRELELGPG